jgi:hypothetical protein
MNSSLLIETSVVNRANLADFLNLVPGCWKCASLLWMQSSDFPVLPGLILSGWTEEAEVAVSGFCRDGNFSELLVRIEKPGQRWTRRRGGYTIPVSAARNFVDDLAKDGMLAVLLEPASPYSDLHSLTSVCDLVTGKVVIEVVGPGFDASDILRSDTLPHERFEALAEINTRSLREPQETEIRRVHLVDRGAYQISAQQRLAKIGARLRNPAFPEEVLEAAAPGSFRELAQEATRYLQKTGKERLLGHLTEYEPIPNTRLNEFLHQLLRLVRASAAARVPWKLVSVAGSFLESSRLVMWDFFPPGDQDTSILAALTAAPLDWEKK